MKTSNLLQFEECRDKKGSSQPFSERARLPAPSTRLCSRSHRKLAQTICPRDTYLKNILKDISVTKLEKKSKQESK